MWRKTRLLSILLISAFFCLCAPSAGICSANRTYEISETELQTLSEHLTALEQNNSELERLLNESGVELTTASTALIESRNEIEKLQTQLKKLQQETNQLSESLRIANSELQNARISFRESEKERDRIEGRLRTQRNIWEVLCFLAVGVAVAK